MDRVNHTMHHVQRTFCASCPGICPGYRDPLACVHAIAAATFVVAAEDAHERRILLGVFLSFSR
jgi:hypothetical protein